jgi:hypothetical protein
MLGQKVTTLVNGYRPAGTYKVVWEVDKNMPSGIYIYRLQAGSIVMNKKLMLVK